MFCTDSLPWLARQGRTTAFGICSLRALSCAIFMGIPWGVLSAPRARILKASTGRSAVSTQRTYQQSKCEKKLLALDDAFNVLRHVNSVKGRTSSRWVGRWNSWQDSWSYQLHIVRRRRDLRRDCCTTTCHLWMSLQIPHVLLSTLRILENSVGFPATRSNDTYTAPAPVIEHVTVDTYAAHLCLSTSHHLLQSLILRFFSSFSLPNEAITSLVNPQFSITPDKTSQVPSCRSGNSRNSGCGADTGTNCWAHWSASTGACATAHCYTNCARASPSNPRGSLKNIFLSGLRSKSYLKGLRSKSVTCLFSDREETVDLVPVLPHELLPSSRWDRRGGSFKCAWKRPPRKATSGWPLCTSTQGWEREVAGA